MLSEATDPLCLRPGEAEELLDHAPWRSFLVIGDSLSLGTGDPVPGYRHLGWSDRTAETLGRIHADLEYVNLAEIGATTARVIDTQLPSVEELRPDLIHLPSGPNDLFRATLDYARFEEDLTRLYLAAERTGALVTCFTLGRAFVNPAVADWTDRIRRVNMIVRSVAQAHDAVLVDMQEHPVNDRPDVVSADGIHFSSVGQAVMAAEVVRALATRIDSWPGARRLPDYRDP